MKISVSGNLEKHYYNGLREFAAEFGLELDETGSVETDAGLIMPETVNDAKDAQHRDTDILKIKVAEAPDREFMIRRSGYDADIFISKPVQIFRGLSLILQNIGNMHYSTEEHCYFDTAGAMFDVSQASSLMTVATCKRLLKYMAAMGLNMFMLYCEDCYEVEGEPLWGYMRPKYTQLDFKELDDYAYDLGIEMIPCIQTLGHLTEALKWGRYKAHSEDPSTLLVGDERTYALLDKLIRTVSAPFRSRRIHVGLDEAWGLGQGQYLIKNGFRPKFEIMCEHVGRVVEITDKYGLKPMMWGDMLIRGASRTGAYYDEEAVLPEDIRDKVPPQMQIIYWDYYHEYDFYSRWIDKFRLIRDDVIFAGCSRNVRTFGSHHAKTIVTTNDALKACKEKGVREVFATVWGDDHRESSVFSILPGLQLYAEHTYYLEPDESHVASRFKYCTGIDYELVVSIKDFDQVPHLNGDNINANSPSKTLMWQDILLGLFDAGIADHEVGGHYGEVARRMAGYAGQFPSYRLMFEFYSCLGETLALKSDLGNKITKAYRYHDTAALEKAAHETLPELRRKIENQRLAHREHFFEIHKPIGWEILDIRYGGAAARAETAQKRLLDYLDGTIDRIEELEQPRLCITGSSPFGSGYDYSRICSASRL